jgi:hypothetical protein
MSIFVRPVHMVHTQIPFGAPKIDVDGRDFALFQIPDLGGTLLIRAYPSIFYVLRGCQPTESG